MNKEEALDRILKLLHDINIAILKQKEKEEENARSISKTG